MKKIILILSLILAFYSTSADAVTLRTGHPRIHLNSDNIAAIRASVAPGGINNDVYLSILGWCNTNWGVTGMYYKVFTSYDNIEDLGALRYALIYALGTIPGVTYTHPVADYGGQARDYIMGIIAHWPSGYNGAVPWTAVAYDWIYDYLTTTERSTIANWLITYGGTRCVPNSGNNGYKYNGTPKCLYPGLALWGDGISDTLTQSYVDYIPVYLSESRAQTHMAGSSGGIAAGPGYGWHFYDGGSVDLASLYDFLAISSAANLTTNPELSLTNVFAAYPFAALFPQYLIYNTRPGAPSGSPVGRALMPLINMEDTGEHMWNLLNASADPAMLMTLRVAAYVQNQLGYTDLAKFTAWFINNRFGTTRNSDTWDIFYNDRGSVITPTDPTTLGMPLSKAFGWNTTTGAKDTYLDYTKAGMGEVTMRSNWSTSGSYSWDKNTTQAMFRAFPYLYYGHQHFDSLTFTIFKGDVLLQNNTGVYWHNYEGNKLDTTDPYSTGLPHHYNYYVRMGSNIPLIMDPNEVIMEDNNPGVGWQYKDGAQRSINSTKVCFDQVEATRDGGTPLLGSPSVPRKYTERDWGEGLVAFEDVAGKYTFTAGDSTRGYNSTTNTKAGKSGFVGIKDSGYAVNSPKTNYVRRDIVYSKSTDGNSDYFIVYDRVNSLNAAHKKGLLWHFIGEPILYNNTTPITPTLVYGINEQNGLTSTTSANTFTVQKATSPNGKLVFKTLLPASTTVYKNGGTVTATLTADVNAMDGATFGGAKTTLYVTDASGFVDRPTVVIDNEAFQCNGKTANSLTDCLRGPRYYQRCSSPSCNRNTAATHSTGATVTQEYTWMVQEVDTGNWIPYPVSFGSVTNNDGTVAVTNGAGTPIVKYDELGKYTLRIDSMGTEENTNFLHVFFPTTNLSAGMPTTTLISSSAGNSMKGALIADTIPRIVMFPTWTTDVTDSSYVITSSGTGRHLITGLVAGGTYAIYKAGSVIGTQIATSQGTVYFETAGGTNVTYRVLETSGPAPSGDTTAPSVPSGLTATTISNSQINLSWNASTDNVGGSGIAGYKIYQSGTQITTVTASPFSVTSLTTSTLYSFTVAAFDVAGNTSSQSTAATATTSAGGISDTTPPVRSAGSPSGTQAAGRTSTTLSVTTNENATCKYSLIAGVAYASMPNTFTGSATSHSATITGLTDGATYNSYVRCIDASGNANPDDFLISWSLAVVTPSPTQYVTNDFSIHTPPSISKPAKGVPYQDANYNLTITRITDAATEAASFTPRIHAGYPKHNIENADGTKLIMQSDVSPCWHVWRTNSPWGRIADIPIPAGYQCNTSINCAALGISCDSDARWDSANPDILYFYAGPILYQYNAATQMRSVVHDFTNDFPGETIIFIGMGEEGVPSADNRYWAFYTYSSGISHQTHLLVYDKTTDAIVSHIEYAQGNFTFVAEQLEYTFSSPVWIFNRSTGLRKDFNSVSMSPDGDYVIAGAPPTVIYPRGLTSTTMRHMGNSHFTPGYDVDGNEVIVYMYDYWLPTNNVYQGPYVWMYDIATDTKYPLVAIGNDNAHLSANSYSKKGWAIVSIYEPSSGSTDPPTWADRQIIGVELSRRTGLAPDSANHALLWRMADTHTLRKGYRDDPFAKINRAGTKVWFGTAWDVSYYDKNAYDVYQIDLPATWYEDLTGFKIITSSFAIGTISSGYSQTIQVTGGSAPYTCSLASGALPIGLSLNPATGVISGTPTTLGAYNFTIRVNDASSPARTATKSFSVTVNAATAPPAAPKGMKIISSGP